MAKADPAFHWAVTPSVIAVGILGMLDDSRHPHLPNAVAAHVLFGIVLWLSVTLPFAPYMNHSAFAGSADIDRHARRLSRKVYLVLYVLAGAKEWQAIRISGAASAPTIAESMQGLQCYLLCGVCALITIRAMAALYRRGVQAPRAQRAQRRQTI